MHVLQDNHLILLAKHVLVKIQDLLVQNCKSYLTVSDVLTAKLTQEDKTKIDIVVQIIALTLR